ncbi:MAG: DUF1294 domain-containing protein [Alloprevotella sp.]|nr:DUF1294 domain-containing protein [Alloprevotella sp.]MBR1652558.1 DUF1294 domain-containing protein [Alloprevotella sp.]
MFTLDLYIYYFASLLTFALFGWDKHLAVTGRSRVPEAVLLILSFLGGAFGGLCGMIFFRHKTRKTLFLILVPLFVMLQLAVSVLLRCFVL